MDGFRNIAITNFRGIDHLEIGDFSRVNVFLGHNSSGKSTVLEAILLLMGMSNPDLPQTINSIRSRSFSTFADLGYIFHNYDLQMKPEIASELFDGTKRHLTLALTYVFDGGVLLLPKFFAGDSYLASLSFRLSFSLLNLRSSRLSLSMLRLREHFSLCCELTASRSERRCSVISASIGAMSSARFFTLQRYKIYLYLARFLTFIIVTVK